MITRRIVFMGTPEFAMPSLEQLIVAGPTNGWQVVGVATQPDRRAGRGRTLTVGPVKQIALDHDIPVLQPVSLRKQPEMIDALAALAADLFVVAAYGLILPQSVLALPRFGSINVHASLLPAYRGASPITAALLDGLDETGVSIMLMDEGMDTGPVLVQTRLTIAPEDTTASLSARLALLGAETLTAALPRWLAGALAPVDQTDLPGKATYCRLLKKEDGRIDWTRPAAAIERMTRAYTPWPGAHTSWHGAPFKIVRAAVAPGHAEPGTVIAIDGGAAVGTDDGLLLLQEVQPAGKRAMELRSFLNGAPDFVGSTLGA